MGQGYSIRPRAATKSAEIFLYENIGAGWFGGVSALQFGKDLKEVGTINTIDLRINSQGGDVYDGLAIYRLLVDHPARIVSYVDSIAASIASVIAMAGDEIRIAEAATIMIHNAHTVTFGDAATHAAAVDQLNAINSSLADVYVARTGRTKDEVAKWMDAETTMSSVTAVERGFADMVVENLKIAAHATGMTKLPWAKTGLAPTQLSARPAYDLRVDRLRTMRAQAVLAGLTR